MMVKRACVDCGYKISFLDYLMQLFKTDRYVCPNCSTEYRLFSFRPRMLAIFFGLLAFHGIVVGQFARDGATVLMLVSVWLGLILVVLYRSYLRQFASSPAQG